MKDTEKEANKRAIDSDPNDDCTQNELLYGECNLVNESIELDGEDFHICGRLFSSDDSKDMGFIDIRITPNFDLIVDLIEKYVKKLNKVKNVLESVKD
jgi:hypothetical protein